MIKKYFLFLPLVIFLFFITRGIDLPYVGPNAFNFNTYSIIAHNYNKFGLISTKLAPIVSASPILPQHPVYYLHHPPLLSVIEALFFAIFGEHFWTGRLTVIIFSFLSLVLIYLIGYRLNGRKFAFLSLSVASLLPAFSMFGRMIGQEPLVLFFALLVLFLMQGYLKKNRNTYLFFIYPSIILGTLSDWPMIYFVLSLAPYLIYKKRFKLLLSMLITAIITALLFLLYIALINSGFSDLQSAFINRSLGQLLTLRQWPSIWATTILLRFFVYFNPVITLFSFFFLFKLFVKIKNKHLSSKNMMHLGLFIFGFIHVVLYPEGSFGHPYWIYYFIPFIIYSSVMTLLKFSKNYFIFLVVFLFSFFLLRIEKWKTGEIKANIWRYDLAQKANEYLLPYEKIAVNQDSSMDIDVLHYKFLHDVDIKNNNSISDKKYRHYVYSCTTICSMKEDLQYLIRRYNYKRLGSSQGEAYIFFLKEPAIKSNLDKINKASDEKNATGEILVVKKESIFKMIYIYIKGFLHLPQI
ncbi:MAG: glycosyltransferase family 39 protein [Candidatus Pacearchaeota archaeon]